MMARCCAVLFALICVFHARPAVAQCTYSVSPTSVSVPSTGSNSSVTIITGSTCAWTAVSHVSWITITSAASGSGLSPVSYSVAANSTGATRVGTMTIAGRTVTVTQSGGSCGYSVSPTNVSAPSTGTSTSISIITGSGCPWTAVSSDSWITFTSSPSGSGLGSVSYNVAANTTSASRTGTRPWADVRRHHRRTPDRFTRLSSCQARAGRVSVGSGHVCCCVSGGPSHCRPAPRSARACVRTTR